MKNIVGYDLLMHEDYEALVIAVQALIDIGWQPIGRAVVITSDEGNLEWCYQTMVKYEA